MAVAVVDRNGIPLMPTSEYRARKLLKSGKACIHKYRPLFTICLTDREGGDTQPVEYKCDTGYKNIGISVCSEKHEYLNDEYAMLSDEPERHSDSRKLKRTRHNRKRYRAARFDNRKGMISKEGFAPSIRNKMDCHINKYKEIISVIPVSTAVFEMGQFDTQVLKAVQEGRPLPQGEDYQHGERYGIETLREAVFTRDGHKCIICGKPGILHVHHMAFWKNDRTNRMPNLGTVCHNCHTPKNHKPGGKLYGLEPKLKTLRAATFMTMVRWAMLRSVKAVDPDVEVRLTYGAATKLARKDLGIKKTHSNDAYSMGEFHPKHRTDCRHFKKRRRNNRILEKFYDAKYIDIRDGRKKSGSQLSCNRTNRREPRMSDKNERIYHGQKVSIGRRSIRKQRYPYQPGDKVTFEGGIYTVKGTHCNGTRVMLENGSSVAVKKLHLCYHAGGWVLQKRKDVS